MTKAITGQDQIIALDWETPSQALWYVDATDILVSSVKSLSQARTLSMIIDVVRRAARQLTGADGATFVLRDNGNCHYAEEDAVEPLWKGQRFPMNMCISGWVMQNAMPVVIEDVFKDPRIPGDVYRKTFVKSMAMVPIRSSDPIGAIGNYWARPYRPSKRELWALQSLADITSLAIENVNLYELLQQKLQALEDSNHELGRFAWMISRDLKDPLQSMEQLVGALEESMATLKLDEPMTQIHTLKTRIKRMEQRLDDVLEYAQMEKAMDPDNASEEIDGSALLQEAIVLVRLPAGFTVKTTGNLKDMRVQRMPLQQILCHLIGNAIKHHDKSGGIISLDVQDERVAYRITVSDDGPGIDRNVQPKLFEMFQKIDSKQRLNNSGMGLALVKKVLLNYGCNIVVHSGEGRGATFEFTWPKPLSIMTGK